MSAKKSILLLPISLEIGGEQKSTLTIAQCLHQTRYRVGVFAFDGDLKSQFAQCTSVVFSFGKIQTNYLSNFTLYTQSLSSFLKGHSFDILHCQSIIPLVAAVVCKYLSGSKADIIFHSRGVKLITYSLLPFFLFLARASLVTNTFSELNKYKAARLFKIRTKVIYNVPNICDSDRKPPISSVKTHAMPCFNLLYVGRLRHEKGLDILLDALSIVKNTSVFQFQLDVVGDGPSKAILEYRCRKLNLTKYVIFHSFQEDPSRFMLHSDLLILPSRHESFGTIIIEALDFNLPVLSTATDGPLELSTLGLPILLAKQPYQANLAKSIISVQKNYSSILDRSIESYSRYKHIFTRDRMLTDLKNLYD